MMKKEYITPTVVVMEMDDTAILAGSLGSKVNDVNGSYDFDGGNRTEETDDPNRIF